MILMTMRDHKSSDLINVFLEICDIRNNKINTEHIVSREGKTAVHNNDIILVLKCGDIHTDLFQTTEWNDLQSMSHQTAFILLVGFLCHTAYLFCNCFICFCCNTLLFGSLGRSRRSRSLRLLLLCFRLLCFTFCLC